MTWRMKTTNPRGEPHHFYATSVAEWKVSDNLDTRAQGEDPLRRDVEVEMSPLERLTPTLRKVWQECRLREKATLPPELMDDGVVYLQLRLHPPRGPIQMQTWKQEIIRASRIIHANFEDPDVRASALGIAILLKEDRFETTTETFPLHDVPF